MSNRRKFQLIVDLAMTLMLPILMAYSLSGEAVHEWVGIAMFMAFVIHNYMNRQWHKRLFKGNYHLARKVQTVLNLILFGLMLAMILSGMAISRHVFTFFPFSVGVALARLVHLAAAYWFFIFTAIHLGFHWNILMGMARKMFKLSGKSSIRTWLLRGIVVGVSCFGLTEFIGRNLLSYLFLQTQFVFIDFTESLLGLFIDYSMIMCLFIALGHYGMMRLIRRTPKNRC